jgi:Tol biopolymer transport system component
LGNASNTDRYLLPAGEGAPIKLPKGGYWIREPGVSPDGKWLAAIVRNPDGRINSMELVAADGSSVRPLRLPFEVGPSTFRPPFTPDGRNLILFGKAPGESVSKIYSVPLDGSAPKALATLPATSTIAGRLDLSPDGSAVVFTSTGPWTSKIYEIDVTPILRSIKQ